MKPPDQSETLKQSVRDHWEARPCGTVAGFEVGTPAYFQQVERERYREEPFIPAFAEFWRWRDKRVLEIGIGQGTDFMQFARAGATLTGVDLTDAAISLTRQRLEREGLSAELHRADAESLPFDDGQFDLVYSWGVLHHTPNTQRAIDEVRRVTRPEGDVRIMLYERHSWTALAHWLRYGLAAGRPRHSIAEVLADHMESPGTKAYTNHELASMFSSFSQVEFQHFITPYDRRLVGRLADLFPSRFGWFVGIRAKP